MPTQTPDLWPADIFAPAAPVATPVAVLRQQGDALGARTHNFVRGDVETVSASGKSFEYTLYLSAPLLRYHQALVRVQQPQLEPYPATVVETDLTKQPSAGRYWTAEVSNEHDLQDRLREFFNEPRVKEILRSLINLSNDISPPDGE